MTQPEKNKIIRICMGSSCFSRGNKQNLLIIQEFLKDKKLNMEIELSGSLCREQCSQGPVITIGEKDYFHMDPNTLLSILKQEYPE